MKTNKTMREQAVPNHRRKDKESESTIDSATHMPLNKKNN
jgi:hypothetical protein